MARPAPEAFEEESDEVEEVDDDDEAEEEVEEAAAVDLRRSAKASANCWFGLGTAV